MLNNRVWGTTLDIAIVIINININIVRLTETNNVTLKGYSPLR